MDPATDIEDAADALYDEDALEALSLDLRPRSEPPGLRARLLAAARGPARFLPFVDRLAALLDLDAGKAEGYLDEIDGDASRWKPLLPGVRMRAVKPGPAHLAAGATGCLFRVAPGATFPYHRHLGPEYGLVVQGSCVEDDGSCLRRGDSFEHPPGTGHSFVVDPAEEMVFAVLSFGVAMGRGE